MRVRAHEYLSRLDSDIKLDLEVVTGHPQDRREHHMKHSRLSRYKMLRSMRRSTFQLQYPRYHNSDPLPDLKQSHHPMKGDHTLWDILANSR